MRRYNLALACARTSKGCYYGIPATRDEIGERCRGAFSNAMLDLPPSAFNEAIGVLASLAEQANAVRIDDEDDALFVDVYYLRRVAKERHELMDFIEALERIEARRLRERIAAEANVATPSAVQPVTPPTDPAPPTVVSCNKHTDCDAADIAAQARGEERGAVHCHDDCCEDCFGS